jgi:hypothetical protein
MVLLTQLPSFLHRDSVLVVAGAGLVSYSIGLLLALTISFAQLAHAVFKRTETHDPKYIVLLLLVVPALLVNVLVNHSSTVLSAFLTTFTVYWATLSASIVVYRLSPWHPLAKYPGPLICKVTKFWFAFLSLRGKQHIYYDELHAKYGDVVRVGTLKVAMPTRISTWLICNRRYVGPNELSILDSAAITPLMGPSGLAKGPCA